MTNRTTGARCRAAVIAVLAALCTLSAHAAAPATPALQPLPPLPLLAYAQSPAVSQVVLSPDGQRIAGLMNADDQTFVFSQKVSGDRPRAVLKTDNKLFTVSWLRWVNDERIILGVRYASRRGFVATVETRLLSVRHDGSDVVNLVQSSPFDARKDQPQFQDRILDWLPDDGQHVLMQMSTEGGISPAVFKVNVNNGRREMVRAPQRHGVSWLTDASHRVRVGLQREGTSYDVSVSDENGQNWRKLWRFKAFSREAVWPIGFGKDPNVLYIEADHEGREALFQVDLRQTPLQPVLRLADEDLDVSGGLIRSPKTGEVVGLRNGLADESRASYWDPGYRNLALAVDKALPQRHNRLLSFSRDESRYLVYSSGNGIAGQYYLGDRATGDLSLLADTYPELTEERLVGKKAVRIEARDGLSLRAYLTLPHKGAPGPSPLVLLPHGGPGARDDQDFDPWTEFLASRGYAVLQVNFRGSVGYGHAFMAAGLQRWGLEMQDDLTDAVQWAVKQGVADPKRVCIVGASYGGYAALMGAVKTPELYRCVVSFAGVTDLIDLWRDATEYVDAAEFFEAQVGHGWRDRERLKATSPSRQAGRVQAPVLLVHGTADRSVPFEQSEAMADALKSAGKPYRLVTLEEGDHHLTRQAHSITFFTELEAFLKQHLPVNMATPAPVQAASGGPALAQP